MMPLTLANVGEQNMIKRIGGIRRLRSILKILVLSRADLSR
jgi:hypothetical protein